MSALGQDFREDMVSIGKVSGEERTERPEAVVESLAHVPDGLLVPFGQGRAGGVHEHVVESFCTATAPCCFAALVRPMIEVCCTTARCKCA